MHRCQRTEASWVVLDDLMVACSDTLTYGIVDPYGRYLYVTDQQTPAATGGIYAFTISQSTGALTPVPGSPFTANLNIPAALAIDQSGTYLYAANSRMASS